jgi:hypothetical protein
MMKKTISVLLLVAVLLSATALADSAPSLSNDLFSDAKEALSLLSYGEFARVSEVLPFSGTAPSESEWESFAENFQTLDSGTVQREISVAFYVNGAWYLAVPVSEPSSGSVEALVLRSPDGEAFDGYNHADWETVEKGYGAAERVLWNKEYIAGKPIVIAD